MLLFLHDSKLQPVLISFKFPTRSETNASEFLENLERKKHALLYLYQVQTFNHTRGYNLLKDQDHISLIILRFPCNIHICIYTKCNVHF